jgi:phospholipase C
VSRAALLASIVALAGASPAAAESHPTTPIEHFIVLMQENHSFDNYFGTYPGADGIPKSTCMPIAKRSRPCVRPFRLGGRPVPDLSHDRRIHRIQYARGRMDGFVRAASIDRQTVDRSVMGYYDDRDLPFYWNVADEYVLFDRFFAATTDGSVASHMFWVTGTPGDADGGFGDRATIFDRLDRRGISWKFYVEDYDPRQRTQAVRVPLLNSARYVEDQKRFTRIVDLDEYYEDLRDGRLPQVAYIAPAGSSEHPPGRIGAGEALVKRLITALSMSSAWDSSAFMWTYDDWGGWFDHVRPPRIAGGTLGFRVPALLVSPYARRGDVDSTRLDTTSILRFIEDNWALEPLASRDARANTLAGAFDFSKEPRAPSIVAAERGSQDPTAVRRWVIYVAYGAALVLSALLIGWGVLRPAAAVLAIAVLLTLHTDAADARTTRGGPVPPTIQTVPAAPGMRFALHGHRFEADRGGRATPPATFPRAGASLRAIDTEIAPGVRARFDRWYAGRKIAALNLYHRVGISFVDLDGHAVAPSAVTSVTLQGSDGSRHVLTGGRPVWLQGNRVVPERQGRTSTRLYYAVEKALVAGSNAVHRGQQRFFPAANPKMQLRLLLFAVRVTVRDALLGFPIGSAVRLTYPNGGEQRETLGPSADLTLESLPRGDYRVGVEALGISSSRPVALSRNQEVNVQVISWLDIVVVLLTLGSIALALLFVRRPASTGRRHAAGVVASVLVAVVIVTATDPPARAAGPPDPLFAYYYIWFNAGSWNRAKIDYPLLGRYSSDEREVMRTHVEWAKRAGIDGFIVSWKSTPVLNRRLRRLAEVAEAERFKLLVIYQGLDFEREPLPAARVARDLDVFEHHFARRRAFQVFAKPLVIWSGTPRFTRAQLASVTEHARRKMLVLASERNVAGYRRVAGVVDGNAYYWGSVDPATYPGYAEKLATMGEAIHSHGGLWIAPAAPGFDARLVGGRSVVDRRDGATLRTQLDAATGSSPDAIGLISWNEFSENTHVEPSQRYGSRYLDVVADVRGARLPEARDFDSSEPAATGVNYGLPLLGGVALFFVGGLLVLLRRSKRRLPPAPDLTRRGYGGPH